MVELVIISVAVLMSFLSIQECLVVTIYATMHRMGVWNLVLVRHLVDGRETLRLVMSSATIHEVSRCL